MLPNNPLSNHGTGNVNSLRGSSCVKGGLRCTRVALALALLLAGCSGGGGGGGGSSSDGSSQCIVSSVAAPTGAIIPLEGTMGSPVSLTENATHSGQVDTTASYYSFTTSVSDESYSITLSGMSDDADLVYYGTDSTYTTSECRPFYGRTTTESCRTVQLADATTIYLSVSGDYTTAGSTYGLLVKQTQLAEVSSPTGVDQGSVPSPVTVTTGALNMATVDDSGGSNSGYSYYKATVTAGQTYGVALSSVDDDLALDVYGADDSFTTTVCTSDKSGSSAEGCTLTAAGSSLHIRVDGTNTTNGDVYGLSVVQAQGDNCDPLATFLEKTNYDQASGSSGSRYKLDVTSGASYTGCIRSRQGGFADGDAVTLKLYNASEGLSGTAACTATSLANASESSLCGPVTADGSGLYAQVTTPNQDGGALFSWQVLADAPSCPGGRVR